MPEAAAPPVSAAAARREYGLTSRRSVEAILRGLAEADWYQSPVPRAVMRELLERKDGPALRDTALWFGLILGLGAATVALWPSYWAAVPYLAYATLYASTSDSRWHESGHGTAFRTDWLNDALYEVASFMVLREAVVWRFSHVRHHSDTIIVGRDPEIAVPQPPDLLRTALGFFSLPIFPSYFRHLLLHAVGRSTPEERTFIPKEKLPGLYLRARVYLSIHLGVLALAVATRSVLPVLLVGGANLFGAWLMPVYGLTQHAGLAEDVLDHRLNCRTVRMNRVHRFLYWNMNFHVEHHMFPLVPYHALPRLHQAVKDDMPPPYPGLLSAWREIVPALLRQVKEPGFHVVRPLPGPAARPAPAPFAEARPDPTGWVEACSARDLGLSDARRLDVGHRSYAIYRDHKGRLFATDGMCTHGNTHLSSGLVKGDEVECPKHNGRFRLADGAPSRAPACQGLATYPVEERQGRLFVNLARPGGAGARPQRTFRLRVAGTRFVATFIKELLLEPAEGEDPVAFTPGDYLKLDIPAYDAIRLGDLEIPDRYRPEWERQGLTDLVARNPAPGRRNNYSIASNSRLERTLRFDVRLASPPQGKSCPPGAGSSWVFSLQEGDPVTAVGPFGDFHVRPTQREMVYIGGGAGMAPLRAHLSHLLETLETSRRISFYYGARSLQEAFYLEYFEELARRHPGFSFHLALSMPLPEDRWTGQVGLVHEVALRQHLRRHPSPRTLEYYLCGPPPLIRASTAMLAELEVPAQQVSFDEF